MAKKQKTYWAGYSGSTVAGILFVKQDGTQTFVQSVFRTRKEAKEIYSDVRKVKIVQVRP